MLRSITLLSLTCLLCVLTTRSGASVPDEPAPGTEVAIIGSERVSFSELPAATQTELDEHQRRYEQRLHQLALENRREQQAILEARINNLIDSRLMQKEARARHTTIAELIKQVKNPPVTDADVRDFYLKHAQEFKQPFEAELVPITQYLMQQSLEAGKRDYLAGLRAKYAARLTFEPLREDVAAEGPSRGPADARVTLVEFADFQCPFCARMAPVLERLQQQYPKDVRLVYRQMPLEKVHPDSLRAAQASLCALEQDKFWPMHDALYADQKALNVAGLKATAARVGLDSGHFDVCLDSARTLTAVQTDERAGIELGVDGTPGLFVNGRFVNGAVPYEQLAAMVDDELQRVKAGSRVAAVHPVTAQAGAAAQSP
jgi:protein-disulfide isomerase